MIAPCTHNEKCGMPLNSWCHFIQRVRRTPLQMSTKLNTSQNFEDEKYSFVILQKNLHSQPQQNQDLHRILTPPIKRTGLLFFILFNHILHFILFNHIINFILFSLILFFFNYILHFYFIFL